MRQFVIGVKSADHGPIIPKRSFISQKFGSALRVPLFLLTPLWEVSVPMRIDRKIEPTTSRIPFNKPYLTGKEAEYVAQAIRSGQIGGDGPYTRGCARQLEERFGVRKVLMTPSCTAALELAAMLCDLGPGDEVIVPSFTFVSTVNAFARSGARPVFVDIRPDTLNIDEGLIEGAITPRTRAIFPVHYAGVGCEMDPILRVARKHGLKVVEDAAQGVNAFYRGRALGAMGHLGTYSFHDTKNLVCGEGGALCVNDPSMIERAEILRDKGTNRAKFFRGEVDKYTWVDTGSSYIPTEIACAFLFAQLEAMDQIRDRRWKVDRIYRDLLGPLEEQGFLRLPHIPEDRVSHCRTFFVVLSSGTARDALMEHLKENGVSAVFHFVPLHSSPMGMRYGYREGDFPVTEDMAARLLRLPSFGSITEGEQVRVADLIGSFLRSKAVDGGSDYCLPCVWISDLERAGS
jgi:dTDP-4-amino-4,6-dideoxygalactose transaminase